MSTEKQRLISGWVDEDRNSLARCLENADFRAFLCRLVAASGVFDAQGANAGDREALIAEGKRQMGLDVLADVEAARHGGCAEVVKQMFEDRHKKADMLREVEDRGRGE